MSDIAPPHLTIRPSKGWAVLNLRELWLFRDLLTTLAARDVKLRYRQTALGAVWVILQPLMAAGIFSFVFGTVAGLKADGIPYFVFSYAGLLGWNVFSGTLTKVSGCLVSNAQLVSKVFFPRLVLPLSTIFSTLMDFGVALLMMFALMIAYGVPPTLHLLLLPVWVLLMLMLSLGIGMFTSALMVSYRDVQYVLPVATNFLMYASPVAYGVSQLAQHHVSGAIRQIFMLNPLVSLLEGFRWSLLGRGTLSPGNVLYAVVCSVIVFISGAYSFKRMERRFADVI